MVSLTVTGPRAGVQASVPILTCTAADKEHPVALPPDEVRHVARLARLALTDDEVAELAPQLSRILAYAEHVGEVAADDVEPTTHPFAPADVTRPDERRPSLSRDDVLAAAPQVEDHRFAVPRIVSQEG